MISPYDWQESVHQRAGYIEARLRGGSPVVGMGIADGVLLFTYRKQVRKVYEVYDRLAFSAIGQQADVESLRLTAVDFAHQEGYSRSEEDVTIGRVVGFALSSPLRRAFGDITTAPFVINALFAEMNRTPADDLFFKLRYDGDFEVHHQYACIAGTPDAEERMAALMASRYDPQMDLDAARSLADEVWRVGADRDADGTVDASLLQGARQEVALLDRRTTRERKFRHL